MASNIIHRIISSNQGRQKVARKKTTDKKKLHRENKSEKKFTDKKNCTEKKKWEKITDKKKLHREKKKHASCGVLGPDGEAPARL